jgi:aspartate carbamoyltransferase catalytic subunit
MKRYEGVHFVLISPEELRLPDYMKHELGENYSEYATIEEAMPLLDVLYMTRVQQERFDDPAEYERLKDAFILDTEKMALAKENMVVLHPLPRVNEITVDVDKDPRAAYFRQVENGKYVRMALIYTLLSWHDKEPSHKVDTFLTDQLCSNDRCIVTTEPVEKKAYTDKEGVVRCYYCDHAL